MADPIQHLTAPHLATHEDAQAYETLLAALRKDLLLDPATDLLPFARPVWNTPTLINAWVNGGAPFETAGYLKDTLGFVHLKGLIQTGASGAVAFVLPAGYRPSATTVHGAGTGSVSAGLVEVDTAGNVKPFYTGAGNSVGLSGITFLAEQ